ncbi:MAG: adenine methyltransferase, partial [Wenzhouxiangella sp.]
MSKSRTNSYELSDAEKRDLTQLIQAGKPLPEKYRFILFEDKREVELVWNGKSGEVCTAVLPFQTLEHVDEPRDETRVAGDQGELFDYRGRQTQGWTNKLIWGDNKLILSSLKSGALRQQIEEAGGLKLIY